MGFCCAFQSCGLKVRHVQVFLLFLSLCVNYVMRNNLSIGIILMTDLNSTSSAKVFDWTVSEKSASQSVFFGGYFLMNLIAAVLVNKFNNRNLLLGSVFVSSVSTLALPPLVTLGGYYVLLAMRFILGLMQGCILACLMGLMSRWIPLTERGRSGALILGGIHLGNLVSFSMSGWIGSHYGWPSTFYFAGVISLIWSVLYALIGAESSATCSYISEEEKQFIDEQLAETSTLPKNVPVPWKKIFHSKECWAVILVTMGHGWGYWTLITEIPSYFNSALHLPTSLNGIMTAAPFAIMWVVSFPMSYVSDLLVRKEIISVTACRKIFNSIGHFGAAIPLIILGFNTQTNVILAMYITGTTLISFSYIGFNINHLDIIPNFAGALMGISNGLGNISAFSGPLFVGFVVKNEADPNEWRIVFWVSSAIFIIGNLAFILMGTAKELDFNKIPEDFDLHNKKLDTPSTIYAYTPEADEKNKKKHNS